MRHYNASITERANRIFNPKQGDFLPDEVSGPVAVIPLTPASKFVFSTTPITSSSSNTVTTTPSDKDTYITGVLLSYVKDATCDAADGQLSARITVDGVVKIVASFQLLTLTAQQDSVFLSFEVPIKADRGTLLQMVGPTFTAGKFSRVLIYYGYTEEVTKI